MSPTGPDGQLLWSLAAALLIGALVGIEREKKKSESDDLGIGGVRTFILFALSGAVAAWLAERLGSGLTIYAIGNEKLQLSCFNGDKMPLIRRISELGDVVSDLQILPPRLDEVYSHFMNGDRS